MVYYYLFVARNKRLKWFNLNLVMNDSFITNKLDIIKALEVL